MPLKPSDLAKFTEDGDGNLTVTLQRFGKLRIALPNSAQTIEVYVARGNDKDRNFRCLVTTDVDRSQAKLAAKLEKANGGKVANVTHCLLADGTLSVEDKPESAEERRAATGSKAAEEDAKI